MTITQTFLKAKHWHLFLLTFGIPMIFQFVMMGTMFASIAGGTQPPDPSEIFNFFKFIPVLMILFMGTLFGWIWSIAMGLQDKVPAGVKMKTTKFKIFFFIPIVYLLLFSVGISMMMSALPVMIENGGKPNIGLIGSMIGIIFPLHFFVMFCIFYCNYFVAKTFKTVELQRETTFSDFVGEFFMIWFYPIGIWIIQPKVNKMAESD
ncbi:hypothetical protein [Chryseolinea soli]|uniref:Uncharacterized protein n=1 Tax=Chryseolinea soli TaxID=2321403 RepID=A0A385SK58_9BACT|nr:hypothetical protein [Chryseolinea soli]AYB30315.1 hypothetical protein D4L85_06795 [Chryseolinea soli]